MRRLKFLIKDDVAPKSIRLPSLGVRAKTSFYLVGACSQGQGASGWHYISRPPGGVKFHASSASAPESPFA